MKNIIKHHKNKINKNKQIVTFCIVLYLQILVALAQEPGKTSKPCNFIIILTDDHGWTQTSVLMDKDNHESRSDYIQMPNIERFALESMRFSQGYAPAPVCSPTRYSIQYGKTPARMRKTIVRGGSDHVNHDQPSLVQMLKEQNAEYKAAHFGKWHIGVAPEELGYDYSDGKTNNSPGGFNEEGNDKWGVNLEEDPKLTFSLSKRSNRFMSQMSIYLSLDFLVEQEELDRAEGIEPNTDGFGYYKRFPSDSIIKYIKKGWIGHVFRVSGWQEANKLQELAEESRLEIPLLIAENAIHGHGYVPGATVYPAPIGLASTWDTSLVRKIAGFSAREMRATGYHWNLGPNIEIARDPRWGRVGETFGEDPYLVGLMGASMVKGFQGSDFSHPQQVIACPKHYLAGSEPNRGLNFSPMDVSKRNLLEIWLPPFQMVLDEGAYTIMAAHHEVNGIPCHANSFLLKELLRDKLGFEGFVVSDWKDVSRLHSLHKIAETRKKADGLAVNSGIDVHMHGPEFFRNVVELVKEGEIPQKTIDDAVKRILYAKFQLGLFENRYADKKTVEKTLFSKEKQALALESANKSMVLLKNQDNLLPLDKNIESVFITGPNSNNQTLVGDWTNKQPDEKFITIKEGIEDIVSQNTIVSYQPIKNIKNITNAEINQATEKARKAKVAIVAVGGNSLRFDRNSRTCGENVARASLGLFGRQLELIKSIYNTGTPTVVVLVNGRPLAIRWCNEHIPAILEAWQPGSFGGKAVAQTLFGDNNPGGKLAMTFPMSVGQIPCYYNYKPSSYFRDYVDEPTGFLYPFGHGLSYTQFEYSDLEVPVTVKKGDELKFSLKISNIGQYEGNEIFIFYEKDFYNSVNTPVQEMKAFRRVSLESGETKTVHFNIKQEQLSFLDKNYQKVVEPGTFELMVGGLTKSFEVME